MELRGFTQPYSASGQSELVSAPPWHYAGQCLTFDFEVQKERARQILPPDFESATGRAFAHFCDWQATTDGWELLDPIYSQYKELIILVEALHPQLRRPVLFCPFIYVDQDVSMVRGLLQGWPKKLGSVWMTRSYDLDHPAAAPLKRDSRFGASLSVKDRRLAQASAVLTGNSAAPSGFLTTPTFGCVANPSIIGSPDRGRPSLVRARVAAKKIGPTFEADGKVEFYSSPRDELHLLSPIRTTAANLTTFALSVTGAEEFSATVAAELQAVTQVEGVRNVFGER